LALLAKRGLYLYESFTPLTPFFTTF
ncbi:MAG: hypothetical protein QOK44_1270, partial [Betaproteobacteria bacterium]|nr:hypothetical protein [Betaproteobacteria bacterium]